MRGGHGRPEFNRRTKRRSDCSHYELRPLREEPVFCVICSPDVRSLSVKNTQKKLKSTQKKRAIVIVSPSISW